MKYLATKSLKHWKL